jgi:regulation of enolase protein 1 (concanavalin A-like superfamily)
MQIIPTVKLEMSMFRMDGLIWQSPPAEAQETAAGLALRTRPRTDFWQQTHYGFRRDDGHFLNRPLAGDFVATLSLRISPTARYDQAGLMVRVDADCWIKLSTEHDPDGHDMLGAVVTREAMSDWSMRPVACPPQIQHYSLRRQGPDYTLFARQDDGDWERLRLARLHTRDNQGVLVGPYACSPTGEGCSVVLLHFAVEPV